MSVDWNNLDQIGRAEMTGYEVGKRDERERIIKLLQPYADCQSINCGSLCECVQRSDWVIALIKGENK